MPTSNVLVQVFSVLISQVPIFLVYVVGAILAIRWWRRYPRPALFVLLGVSLHFGTTVVMSAVQMYVIRNIAPSGGASLGDLFRVIGLASSLLHAGATALLICGAFVGRRPVEEAAFPVSTPAYGRPLG